MRTGELLVPSGEPLPAGRLRKLDAERGTMLCLATDAHTGHSPAEAYTERQFRIYDGAMYRLYAEAAQAVRYFAAAGDQAFRASFVRMALVATHKDGKPRIYEVFDIWGDLLFHGPRQPRWRAAKNPELLFLNRDNQPLRLAEDVDEGQRLILEAIFGDTARSLHKKEPLVYPPGYVPPPPRAGDAVPGEDSKPGGVPQAVSAPDAPGGG